MKTIKIGFIILSLAIMLMSCEEETATVKFRNRSVTNSTFTVYWDGSVIATLYPFTDSEEFEMKTGKHTLRFDISNTGETSCSPSDPILTEGYIHTFTCSK